MSAKGPIIFVDDNLHEHTLVATVIKDLKISNDLLSFSNGPDALLFLTETTRDPFVIICDLNMPGMSGLEFRQHIWENHSLRMKSIPFIIRTGSAHGPEIERAYELTVQGFFRKHGEYKDTLKDLRLIFDYWKRCIGRCETG